MLKATLPTVYTRCAEPSDSIMWDERRELSRISFYKCCMHIDWNVQNVSCKHFALHKAHGSLSTVVPPSGIAAVNEVMKKAIYNDKVPSAQCGENLR